MADYLNSFRAACEILSRQSLKCLEEELVKLNDDQGESSGTSDFIGIVRAELAKRGE